MGLVATSSQLRPREAPALPVWAQRLSRALDDVVKIPGTRWGVGLDGLIGLLVPGAGDALTGAGSIALLLLAFRRRVPTVVLGRMVVNIVVDLVIGLIPVLGDVFDVAWRANRMNLELIQKYETDPHAAPSVLDIVVVGIGLLVSIAALVLPIFLWLFWATAIAALVHRVFGG